MACCKMQCAKHILGITCSHAHHVLFASYETDHGSWHLHNSWNQNQAQSDHLQTT